MKLVVLLRWLIFSAVPSPWLHLDWADLSMEREGSNAETVIILFTIQVIEIFEGAEKMVKLLFILPRHGILIMIMIRCQGTWWLQLERFLLELRDLRP